MARLVFEIGLEEVPHEILFDCFTQLQTEGNKLFQESGIIAEKIEATGTPRRLVLIAEGVQPVTLTRVVEKKGPALKAAYDADGKPTKALEGFLRANGITEKEVTQKEINGGLYIFYEKKEGGEPVVQVLKRILPNLVSSLKFPKAMRWATYEMTFVRPVRWLCALLDKEVIPVKWGHLEAGNKSYGHRTLFGLEAFEISSAQTYEEELQKHFVIVHHQNRREIISKEIEAASQTLGVQAVCDETLLDTLVSLTEYPEMAVGSFEEEFLKLPKEVLISEMIEHQKFIPLQKSDKTLVNRFLIVTNTHPNETIVAGNERVIRARFNDGKFFFDEDRKRSLESRLEELARVAFARNLGSLKDKTERLEKIVGILARYLGMEKDLPLAQMTARLCKTDLVTHMVYEFPELQGIVGYYYALHDGLPINVAISIKEHYWPKFSGDSLPSLPEGILVSLADRFDNLFALYAQGYEVTGSRDPLALRRQTLGIIRILIEKKLHLPLREVYREVFALYQPYLTLEVQEYENRVFDFITTRVKTVFREYGFAHDEIEAGIAMAVEDIYDVFCRVSAIHTARQGENFQNLAIAFRRVKNILKGFEILPLASDKLQEPAEKALYEMYQKSLPDYEKALSARDYGLAIGILTSFRPVVDAFFDQVLVMDQDENKKNARVALLQHVDAMFMKLVDMEKIVIE
ncbi:glycine--tRNA ligase subunit beta [Thermospira aquatica]|uniref:Glycine--tRNA ligase beta subunit n=1 Tax=Thermospira aquatica TaxID=2828656 RepID=A0AAX3BBB3_9SPIR|nr:glycine--tRNA ligase subunit beta [Thermospira aquatica]URA09602.1 glycine--tRNA ligase subunit beta [Thermospira aquatica]